MRSEPADREPERETSLHIYLTQTPGVVHPSHEESVLAALALLLGPETDYHLRVRATRRLARQGPALLPLLLTTLSNYPEITSPPWPLWPPQYKHCSRLLIHLSQSAQVRLETLLHPPAISQPAGPVLWTSVIEAAGLLPDANYETLICSGLATSWTTVRYAAAMALAQLAGKNPLRQSTLEALSTCQDEGEPFPVRLAASYTLLRSSDSRGLEILMKLLDTRIPGETRKAAIFVFATEPPAYLTLAQRERLTHLLVVALQDQNAEVMLNAARAVGTIASPATLPALCALLGSPHPHIQIAALTALEELASRKSIRKIIQYNTVPAHIVPLLRAKSAEVRRQACYTLAALGGEYVTAVLGTTLLNTEHPGHIEAIEGLRLLHGALRAPTRTKIVRWLLQALRQTPEEIQITALDSLAYLVWQAHSGRQKKAHYAISQEIWLDGIASQLLACPGAWVRQRTIELLSILDDPPARFHFQLRHLLHTDADSGVRACIAYILGQTTTRWAIPDLILTLLDSDEHVAVTALNALGNLTSADDAIVGYVLRELEMYSKSDKDRGPLAEGVRMLLKKWRRVTGRTT